MITAILKAIFGTKSQRDLKKWRPLVRRINELEVGYQKLSDEELKTLHSDVEKEIREAYDELPGPYDRR